MYTTAQIGGRTFERKAPFATTSFKKGCGLIFEGGPIIEKLGSHSQQMDAYELVYIS